jgi:preprotein translocase subunit YajC
MFFPDAWAQAAGAAQPSMIEQFFPVVLILGVFFIFIIRPAQKRQKTQAQFLSSLQRGSQVVTSSGILGTIEGITDLYITLEIADGVRIRILKNQIAGPAHPVEVVKK